MTHRMAWPVLATAVLTWLPGGAAGQNQQLLRQQQQQILQRRQQMYQQYLNRRHAALLGRQPLAQPAPLAIPQQLQQQAQQQPSQGQRYLDQLPAGTEFGHYANGEPIKIYSRSGGVTEIGPATPLTNVKYIGNPDITRRLSDFSLLYLWNLTRRGIRLGENIHTHYWVPQKATGLAAGQIWIGQTEYWWTLIMFHPMSEQQAMTDVNQAAPAAVR